jgi:tetratricopeptide (TPR) repeat protein
MRESPSPFADPYLDSADDHHTKGDDQGALATLESGLEAAGLEEWPSMDLACLLFAKATILTSLGRRDEALALLNRVLELTDSEDGVHIHSRVKAANLRVERGEHDDAIAALGDVVEVYGADPDPSIRRVAAWASECRIRALAEVGRYEDARAEWVALRDARGGDEEPDVRIWVARAGHAALGVFQNAQKRQLALQTADEVIDLYVADTDPEVRATLALTMWSRLQLRRRRPLSYVREMRAFWSFIGSNPEPEVVAALRLSRRGPKLLRQAKKYCELKSELELEQRRKRAAPRDG